MWNLLDWPGAVFPTGLVVNPAVDVIDSNFTALGPEDAYNHNLCAFLATFVLPDASGLTER